MKRLHTLLLVLVLVATAAAGHEAHRPADRVSGSAIAAERLLVREIEVTDDRNRRFPFVETMAARGTVLLSFTYTDCETLCPLTNAILSGVEAEATARGVELTIVSMTLDPARDTPTALAEQRALLGAGDDWWFLTAEPARHRQLMSDLAVDVAALEEHDPMFLLGDFCGGQFLRIVGLPVPDKLVALAAAHEPCSR